MYNATSKVRWGLVYPRTSIAAASSDLLPLVYPCTCVATNFWTTVTWRGVMYTDWFYIYGYTAFF